MRPFVGKKVSVQELEQGIAMLTLNDRTGELNKFDQQTLSELHTALSFLENTPINGLVLNSGQSVFMAGGDIREFLARFQQSTDKIQSEINSYHQALNRIESLPCPTLCAINGTALGGGIEIAMACDYRLAVYDALLGSPEVSLGLIPGTGGTVRLPRISGVENALHWIGDGEKVRADQSNIGLIDEICFSQQELAERAISKLEQVINSSDDWLGKRQKKLRPVSNPPAASVFSKARERLCSLYAEDPSLPSRLAAIESIAESVNCYQGIALAVESMHLIQQSRTENCRQLISSFLNRNKDSAITTEPASFKPELPHFSG